MRKIIERQVIYVIIIAITIILICPCSTESYINADNLSVDMVISEIKAEDIEEPLYFDIDKALKKLPENLLRKLYEYGVSISTTEEIGEYSKYGRVTSKYSHRDKKITIQKTYSNESVLFHEIGHAFSYNELPLIKLSDTLRFKRLYKQEKDIIFPDGGKFYYQNFNIKYEYIKVNQEEYFAQCFSMYILGTLPEETKTYSFFYDYFN